jgi:hypothetical protein
MYNFEPTGTSLFWWLVPAAIDSIEEKPPCPKTGGSIWPAPPRLNQWSRLKIAMNSSDSVKDT